MPPLHGTSASLSVGSTTGGVTGGPSSTLSRKQRYSSRSNSISSASVVTVKETAQPEHRRRQSVAVESAERPTGEGLSNLHRWSHSTNSSVSSVNHTRNRASSGAILPTYAFSPQKKKNRTIVDHSPRPSPQKKRNSSRPGSRRRQSPVGSPERSRRLSRPDLTLPLTALPPLHTTPALTDPNDTESPATIPAVATPSTQSSYGQDYFVEDEFSPRNKGKSKKPVMVRTHTASSGIAAQQATGGTGDARRGKEDEREMEQVMNGYTAGLRSKYAEPYEEPVAKPATSSDGHRHKRSRTHEKTEKEKKAMLSKALQKANTAVLLDNAQNFEGALEAYSDACRLLQQVMDRSSGIEDKRKLDSIRITYTNRVDELRQMEAAQPEMSEEKSLPTRPMSDDSLHLSLGSERSPTIDAHFASSPVIANHVISQATRTPRLSPALERDSFFSGTVKAVDVTLKRHQDGAMEKLQPHAEDEQESAVLGAEDSHSAEPDRTLSSRDLLTPVQQEDEPAVTRRSVGVPPLSVDGLTIPPSNSHYMPAPLSPRRSPVTRPEPPAEEPQQATVEHETERAAPQEHNASSSWLDPINESDSDCNSSVHSVSSQHGLHRKHIRGASGNTDPDFDAAFDAAMETAYNEGLEPDLDSARVREPAPRKHVANESIVVPSSEIREILSPTNSWHPGSTLNLDDLDDEEEERLLDDITSDYAQTFSFDVATKSALPRQSDSSGYSRSTWQSSQVSDRTTAGTSLSTVEEDIVPSTGSKNAFASSSSLNDVMVQPPPPPPQGSLPKPPTAAGDRASGVRSRRLSGQNIRQLKIETSTKPDPRQRSATVNPSIDSTKEDDGEQREELNRSFKFGAHIQPTISEEQHEHMLTSPPSLDMLSVASDVSRPMTATTITTEQRRSLDESLSEHNGLKPNLTKNKTSSVSLREHTLIVASPTDPAPMSIITPLTSSFTSDSVKRHHDAPIMAQRATMPTAQMASDGLPGGHYLFDTSLATTTQPMSPKSPSSQPLGLEPCPESSLLRPFWLMRTMASTLSHPKGGFLTTRLFVPRELWQTKGVKLKAVEEKVSNCDLLTAALGRLAGVDTYDADALMEELQNFEEVMERVQGTLVKKLGNDVGIGGLAGVFKDAGGLSTVASNGQASDTATLSGEKTRSKEGKGYLTSWRKLRNKSSGTPINGGGLSSRVNKTAEKDMPTMPSVPMTSYVPVERRGQKREAKNMVFEGPNREYMGSLARLFEGVQVLDQIARQVEDPGLKGSSPTHVGLELSIRHAAEFFGFYVCRFVLADLGVLLDKYVKRGTEWVLV